jgi:hypothetical protein
MQAQLTIVAVNFSTAGCYVPASAQCEENFASWLTSSPHSLSRFGLHLGRLHRRSNLAAINVAIESFGLINDWQEQVT